MQQCFRSRSYSGTWNGSRQGLWVPKAARPHVVRPAPRAWCAAVPDQGPAAAPRGATPADQDMKRAQPEAPQAPLAALAERVEVPELSAFARALRDASVQDLDHGMQLLSFGSGACFPDDLRLRRSDLVIRDFYSTLFERVSSMHSSLLTGVPGIGKSWWIWYAMHQLLNQDSKPAIVWQTFKRGIEGTVLFKDGKAFVGHLSAFRSELGDPSTWYFVDGMLPRWVAARTVMVCPPKYQMYKDWIKGSSHILLTMPLWTRTEIEVLWKALYKQKITKDRALRNFDMWYGGVPRLVLEDPSQQPDESQDQRSARRAIVTTSIEQVLAAVGGAYDTGPEASHRVVHQDGDRNTFQQLSPLFATTHVAKLFAEEADGRGLLARLMRLLANSANPSGSARGDFFEVLKHAVMCSGGQWVYRFADVPGGAPAAGRRGRRSSKDANTTEAALKAATAKAAQAQGSKPSKPLLITRASMQEQSFTAGSVPDFCKAVQQCSPPCYLRPHQGNQKSFDACIYPDTLLQFTVSARKGSLDEEVLEQYLQCLPPQPQYYLDYLVPPDMYEQFKVPALRRRDLPRLSQTYVRVVKV